MNYNIGIYKLTSPSGKVYIGQSTNIACRINQYKNLHCEAQIKLYRAILKYGFYSFTVEVLWATNDETNVRSILDELEIDFINIYNAVSNGYNIKLGGYGGKCDEITKAKISASIKQGWADGTVKGNHKRPIIQIDLITGEVIGRFESAVSCAKALNICKTTVYNNLHKKGVYNSKVYFEYEQEG